MASAISFHSPFVVVHPDDELERQNWTARLDWVVEYELYSAFQSSATIVELKYDAGIIPAKGLTEYIVYRLAPPPDVIPPATIMSFGLLVEIEHDG